MGICSSQNLRTCLISSFDGNHYSQDTARLFFCNHVSDVTLEDSMDRCKEILAANNITKRFQLYKLFSVNDADGSYSLTRDELLKMFSTQLKTDLSNDEVDAIFKAVDVNGDGEVTLKEWVAILFPEST